MVLLAAVPVLAAYVLVASGGQRLSGTVFDNLIIRTVLPLIAIVYGTAALGSELEDGTIVYVLTKPVRRVRVVVAKGALAAGLTAALVVPATLATGLVASVADPGVMEIAVGYAIAAAVGGCAYAMAFLALSAFTSRALALSLGYVLIWEGILSGLLEGTRTFSIRQATLGLAAGISGSAPRQGAMDAGPAVIVLVLAIVGAAALATWRLSRYELRGGD